MEQTILDPDQIQARWPTLQCGVGKRLKRGILQLRKIAHGEPGEVVEVVVAASLDQVSLSPSPKQLESRVTTGCGERMSYRKRMGVPVARFPRLFLIAWRRPVSNSSSR